MNAASSVDPSPTGATSASRPGETSDFEAVTALLGRVPSGRFSVVTRRLANGAPVVIENAPFLDDGRPMPTSFWLVDPELRQSVSQLEASGGVRLAESEVEAAALALAHDRYAARRDAKIPPSHRGPRPSGGVGGTARGVKCLHAHLAWHLAGGDDPVGAWVAHALHLDRSAFVHGDGSKTQ